MLSFADNGAAACDASLDDADGVVAEKGGASEDMGPKNKVRNPSSTEIVVWACLREASGCTYENDERLGE